MSIRLAFLMLLLFSNFSYSHSGRTDENGCHAGSQPYHCHNSGSSSSDDDSSNSNFSVYHLSVGTTVTFSVLSAFYDLQHPLYLSVNESGLGLGASFLDPNKVLYINSKFYSDESVINIGKMFTNIDKSNINFYIGGGVYTEVIDFKNSDDEYEEKNLINVNLGASKSFEKFSLFLDADTGPKSMSIGLAKRI